MHSLAIAAVSLQFAAAFVRPMERVSTMDPVKSQSVYDAHAICLVYETPLEIDYKARPYRLVPGYCELPTVSEDGRTYAFRTRRGPAAPVAAAINRLCNPDEVSPNAWMVKDLESVRVVDQSNVEVRLKRRAHFFP